MEKKIFLTWIIQVTSDIFKRKKSVTVYVIVHNNWEATWILDNIFFKYCRKCLKNILGNFKKSFSFVQFYLVFRVLWFSQGKQLFKKLQFFCLAK